MYPYTYEFIDCQYCGEKIEAFHRRCPYCAGIQDKKRDMPVETDAQSPPEIAPARQPEIRQKPGKPLGNGKKVLLAVLTTLIPVLGQLFGIVISAVCMSSSDEDRSSFGSALFKASVTLSLLGFIALFFAIIFLLT